MAKTGTYGRKTDLALAMWVKLARASATFGRLAGKDIEQYGLTHPQFGVLEMLGSAYISTAWKDVFVFLILIVVLILRPNGLFGEKLAEKV